MPPPSTEEADEADSDPGPDSANDEEMEEEEEVEEEEIEEEVGEEEDEDVEEEVEEEEEGDEKIEEQEGEDIEEEEEVIEEEVEDEEIEEEVEEEEIKEEFEEEEAEEIEEEEIPHRDEDGGGEKKEEDLNDNCDKGSIFSPYGFNSEFQFTIPDCSTELLPTHSSVSAVSETGYKAVILDQQTSSESALPWPLVNKNINRFPMKEENISADRDHVSDGNMKPTYCDGKDSMVEKVNMDLKVNDEGAFLHLGKEASHLPKETDKEAMNEKPRVQRSRSPSADIELETNNKRPAIICDFFAKGWCIKGNSCSFLHYKNGVRNDGQLNDEPPKRMPKLDSVDNAGPKQVTERLSTSSVTLASQTAEDPLSIPYILRQRALVQAFGNERQGEEFPKININDQRQALSMNNKSTTILNNLFENHIGYRDMGSGLNEGLSSKHPLQPMPENRYSSGSSSIGPGLHDPFFLHKHRTRSESSTSYRLDNPLDPALASSLHNGSPFFQTSSQQTNSDTHDYAPLRNKFCDKNITLEFDGGSSRSCSLPRIYSSPKYFQDSLATPGNKTQPQISNDWEPSMRFRSSFYCPSDRISSPGSQYDPLLDSIEPPKANILSSALMHFSGPLSRGSQSPLYSTLKFTCTAQSHESKNIFGDGMGESAFTTTKPQHHSRCSIDGGKNGRMSDEEENRNLYSAEIANIKNREKTLKHQGDRDRLGKEPKVLKFFRAALVEFVKELLKPSWRDGHLSKDAHKMIVKKAVEKVLGALQPHQIPSNTESTNHYFSSSRPKLTKLIEGYVEKYKS